MNKSIIFIVSLLNSACFAGTFECKSTQSAQVAELSTTGNEIFWFETASSAGSRGVSLGVEEAPFAKTRGYLLYDLVDYYRSEDSHFLLKIDPTIHSKESFPVVLVWNNDDVETEEYFACVKTSR